MKKVALGLALAAVAGWFLWTKFQPPPARLAVALARAKKENRLVFLDFTGSDWCGWCIRMDDEALAKPEFIDYSAQCLVTLVVDFPRTHELEPDLQKANKALYKRYGVEGFPTFIALSPDGKVVWKQVGYLAGGVPAVVSPLNRARKELGFSEPAPVAQVTNVAATTGRITLGTTNFLAASLAPATPVAVASHSLPTNAPKLQGIVFSKTNPSAIIEGKECEEGESVRGMRVLKILPTKVVVEWEGRTEELTMN